MRCDIVIYLAQSSQQTFTIDLRLAVAFNIGDIFAHRRPHVE